jgi:hypothetical protein
MADAIPVNSTHQKVNVKPADKSYIGKSMAASDNLGSARDYQHEGTVREMESILQVGPDKVYVHKYTREDR